MRVTTGIVGFAPVIVKNRSLSRIIVKESRSAQQLSKTSRISLVTAVESSIWPLTFLPKSITANLPRCFSPTANLHLSNSPKAHHPRSLRFWETHSGERTSEFGRLLPKPKYGQNLEGHAAVAASVVSLASNGEICFRFNPRTTRYGICSEHPAVERALLTSLMIRTSWRLTGA